MDTPANQPVTPAPQPMPAASAPIAPPMQPNVSGKPSCGYTILIIILTVICTLIAEAVFVFAVATWAANRFMASVKEGVSFTTKPSSDGTHTGGSAGLNADQKALLNKLGIKPEDLPPDLDVQKIACIQNSLGNDRIDAIISGKSTPGFGDLFKAKSCF